METTAETTLNTKAGEQDSNLMQLAHDAFNREDVDGCLNMLEQLEAAHGNSHTITHNRAVAKFYKSDCKNHHELLKVLEKLEEEEASSLGWNRSPIACYNEAVIYFHRNMQRMALQALKPLFENFNKLNEQIASLAGILYLRILIANNLLKKASAFLEFLQRRLGLSVDVKIINDENASNEAASSADAFTRTFKLLAYMTHILNRKNIVIADDGSVEMAALKAHQYYIMKDFQMAAKQLSKINITFSSGNACIANNMGVIHLRVRHYALASKFFQYAIRFDKELALNLKNAPLHEMSSVRTVEILYNLGISMLHLRRPKEAFNCFLIPLKSFDDNPRLWLRMAEACIMEHEMTSIDVDKRPMMKGTIQIGTRKHYVIKPSPRVMYPESSQSAAVPEPTLEFAVFCLRNALSLIRLFKSENVDTDNPENEQLNWRKTKDNNLCNPSTPVSMEFVDNMLLAIYAAYSYVCLRIGDYSTALEMAQELLKAENLTDAHKLLAHMYAGEALIMMNKLSEARPHLDPTFVSSLNAFDFETKIWEVKSLDAAQNIVRYNLAVAMVLQGDYDMARNLINSCKHPLVVHKLKSLRVYLNLKTGNYT